MAELSSENREDIQGFILSGYKHLPHGAYLFLQIRDAARFRGWLLDRVPEITTGRWWPGRFDGTKVKPAGAFNLALTFDGLRACGLPESSWPSFPPPFVEGPAARSVVLGDSGPSAPEHWELGGPHNDAIHLLLLLYTRDGDDLRALVEYERERLDATEGGVVEVAFQDGSRNDDLKNPFGFRDGISNPGIAGVGHRPRPAYQVNATGEFILGYVNEYGLYPPSPVVAAGEVSAAMLPPFPGGQLPDCRDLGRNGSYLVYRKLETDVAGFWGAMTGYARLGGAEDDPVALQRETIYLASKCFGRWPSGAPMALRPETDDPELKDENNFTYESDPRGFGCPIGAHIRRVYPRASLANNTPDASLKTTNRHRIIRRAVYYGEPLFDLCALDRGEVPLDLRPDGRPHGLHFFAVNVDLKNQFEFVQQAWCNNPHFNGLFNDRDPIVGMGDRPADMTIQARPVRRVLADMPRFVTVRGSAYFFMPSLMALQYLGRGIGWSAHGASAAERVMTSYGRPPGLAAILGGVSA